MGATWSDSQPHSFRLSFVLVLTFAMRATPLHITYASCVHYLPTGKFALLRLIAPVGLGPLALFVGIIFVAAPVLLKVREGKMQSLAAGSRRLDIP
jgi:hypothetical protein